MGSHQRGKYGDNAELSPGSREQRGPALQQGAGFSEQHLYNKAASQLSFLLLRLQWTPFPSLLPGERWQMVLWLWFFIQIQ